MSDRPNHSRARRSRTERKLLVRALILGALLTVLIAGLDHAGLFEKLEWALDDARTRYCQFFRRPPTDQLVHVDIDDGALEEIGRWPWPRSVLASVVDELHRAGAKAVAFDMVFSEPELPNRDADGSVTDYDVRFADSLHRLGSALIPASLTFEEPLIETPAVLAARQILFGNLELSPEELNQQLKVAGKPGVDNDEYLQASREAMTDRLTLELQTPSQTLQELGNKLLPNISKFGGNAPRMHILMKQAMLLQSEQALLGYMVPMPPGLSTLHAYSTIAPLPVFAQAARYSGMVDRIPQSDGKVRTVPMVAEFKGRLLPQMGLVLACAALDIDPRTMEIQQNQIILHKPDGSSISIPVSAKPTRFGKIGMFLDVPWFGTRDWRKMYPGALGQHLNIGTLIDLGDWRNRIRQNNSLIDDAAKDLLLGSNNWGSPGKYKDLKLDPDDFPSRRIALEEIKEAVKDTVDSVRPLPVKERDIYKTVPESFDAMVRAESQNDQLTLQIQSHANFVRSLLNGRVVLVGDTASASTDLVNTPLGSQVPGVIVHGVVVSGILTNQLWTSAPAYQTVICTLLVGLLATWAAAFLHWRSIAVAVLLLIGYLVLNGILFFARWHLLVGLAGPVVVIAVTSGAIILITARVEKAERARITRRFRNLVDPQLVEFVLENPDKFRLEGQMKELTVVFTDLVGFTSVTEKLREATVDVLNEYIKRMVPIIRKRHGLLNKFLGDGIMFFFGAPYDNPNHASDAVATVLEMMKATEQFSAELEARGLPAVLMRAGISTGPMIVGDAGGDTASDYTVLGDLVNTGARLEQANKRFESRIMISSGTQRHLGNRFLLRPIGALMVAGKTETVFTYEALALADEATPRQRRFAELSGIIVDQFASSSWAGCIASIQIFESEFGRSKFVAAYEDACRRQSGENPTPGNYIIT